MTPKPYYTPLAIVFGAAMIATAVFFSDFGSTGSSQVARAVPDSAEPQRVATPDRVDNAAINRTADRRVYGNADAPITIVEFSDLECPFCARLHTTLKDLVDQSNGQINWEYRHLPLPMHQNAEPAAVASECVAKFAGNDAFWTYLDILFANIGKANAVFLKQEAGKLGLTAEQFDSCVNDSATATLVDGDVAAITNRFGPQGTPFSLVVNNADDSAQVISGAQPRAAWDQAIARAVQ